VHFRDAGTARPADPAESEIKSDDSPVGAFFEVEQFSPHVLSDVGNKRKKPNMNTLNIMEDENEKNAESVPFASLPEPNKVDVLQEALNAAQREVETLSKELADREGVVEELRERVQALESNPFIFALANMDFGSVLEDVGERFKSMVGAVTQFQKKGTMKISLSVKPFKGRAMAITPDISTNEPREAAPESIFFTDEEGKISRNDPRQGSFDFGKKNREEFRD